MISVHIEEKPDLNWNKRLLESDLATIYQTKEWGLLLIENGKKPLFLEFVNEEGIIIGQLLILVYSRFQKRKILKNLLPKILGKNNLIFTWSYGPIIFEKKYTKDVLTSLNNYLITNKCRVRGVTHPLLEINPSYFSSEFKIQKWITYLINLKTSKDEIFKRIDKHSGRKNIERSINRGVSIEQITDQNFSQFQELINQQRLSQGKEKLNFQLSRNTWNLLKPIGYSGFLAKFNDKPIGGLLFSFPNKYIIEAAVARSKEDAEKKLYSQDLIKWNIIQWGIENKMNYYDLAGANPNPLTEKEKGILRYKKKWGGKKHEYYIVTKKPGTIKLMNFCLQKIFNSINKK